MTKEKMKWKSEQDRWQKDYKRRTLYITPRNLGGTCREDTVVLANRWFEERKAEIDAEDGIKRLRPHEPEHREELERLQAEIKRLTALLPDPAMRPIAAPVIELAKAKAEKIRGELHRQKLSPLKDSLRSPLSLSEKEFSNLDWLFLGHAPKTTAGQHYSVALAKKLDPCMKWLEEEILSNFSTVASEQGE